MITDRKKVCCVNCFCVSEIRRFVEENDNMGKCDYCGSRRVNVRAVDEVGEFVLEGFLRYYEDAAQSVGYASSEGGYLLPTKTIDELLIWEKDIFGDALGDPQPLVEDLVDLDGTPYVRKDPYGPPSGSPEEIDFWTDFCDLVKNKQRFTALIESQDRRDDRHPFKFLDNLAKRFADTLLMDLSPGIVIYRARLTEEGRHFEHQDLTSPPPEKTRNNRMSPAGISFFYGGLDVDSCITEMRSNVGQKIAVARFEVLKELKILNLTSRELGEKVSIFSEDYYFEYEEYFKPFLKHFVWDIAKPIRPVDSEIEYTPTQVFTEFIKTRVFHERTFWGSENKDPQTFKVDGFIFDSSLKKGGVNLVLFKGPDISTEHSDQNTEAWLLFRGFKLYEITGIKVDFSEAP